MNDWRAYAGIIKLTNPQIVLFPGSPADLAGFVRSLRAINADTPILGGDAVSELEAQAREFAGVRYVAFFQASHPETPAAKAFVAAFIKYGVMPSSAALAPTVDDADRSRRSRRHNAGGRARLSRLHQRLSGCGERRHQSHRVRSTARYLSTSPSSCDGGQVKIGMPQLPATVAQGIGRLRPRPCGPFAARLGFGITVVLVAMVAAVAVGALPRRLGNARRWRPSRRFDGSQRVIRPPSASRRRQPVSRARLGGPRSMGAMMVRAEAARGDAARVKT